MSLEFGTVILKIEAPDLVNALREFVAVMTTPVSVRTTPSQSATQDTPVAPVQSAPVAPTQIPTAPVQPPAQQPQATVPTTAPTYTLEQLAVAATPLIDGGKRQALVNLLAAFGVRALTELPKERYGEFATALRQMGAKI